MKKNFLLFVLTSSFAMAQMPNIAPVWQNESQPYIGTIGNSKQEIRLKINVSEQNKKNDQEYFVAGYSLVDANYVKFEGKFIITKYRDSGKKGTVFGTYELAEELKGKHSGKFTGKFVYTFKWDKTSEKIVSPQILLTGDWISYDKTLNLKTRLKNQ